MMRRVLIANRGEIACRIIRACRTQGIASVAVYSDADKESLHVEEADDARHIGAANPKDSYLKTEVILAAAKDAKVDAIHPGYGFLAENADFADAVESADLIWIGPRPQNIRQMGDKNAARKMAQVAGVPVLPGSERVEATDSDLLARAGKETGYPLLIKATAGGGGIGMRLVQSPDQLADAAQATSALAERAFGDGGIFLERFIANARHVEVQVFGFGDGNAVHFFERECSVQRRFQKVIEEAPSPGVSDSVRANMHVAAVVLAQACRYAGAGTVEFIVDDDDDTIEDFGCLTPILEGFAQSGKPLVIFARNIIGSALGTLVVNVQKAGLKVAAIAVPEVGNRIYETLEDIAALTGGEVVSKKLGHGLQSMKPHMLGQAECVEVSH